MRVSQRIVEHLSPAIETTALAADPFAHVVFAGAFPPDVDAKLLARLPADDSQAHLGTRFQTATPTARFARRARCASRRTAAVPLR